MWMFDFVAGAGHPHPPLILLWLLQPPKPRCVSKHVMLIVACLRHIIIILLMHVPIISKNKKSTNNHGL